MYQPRRVSDSVLERPQSDGVAFRTGPRRAARTRTDVFRTRVAPTAVSVALLATSGALAVNLRASESTTSAVPAPARVDDPASRAADRTLAADDASELPAEAAAEGGTEASPAAATFAVGSWQNAFGTVAGQQYAQATLIVRAQATSGSAELGRLAPAEQVTVTDRTAGGYRQVSYHGKVGYVLAARLGDEAPAQPAAGGGASGNSSAKASSQAAAVSSSSSKTTFFWPTAGSITSPWGPRLHPILRYVRLHGGADIGGAHGAPIYAVYDGVVTKAASGYNSGSGNNIRIDHGQVNGQHLESGYLHMSSFTVSAGQRVKRGQMIGRVGSTGLSTAPHLHFSMYVNGANSNPAPFLARRA